MVEEAVRDARLLRDVADARGVEAVAREDAHGRVEDLPALLLLRAIERSVNHGRIGACAPTVRATPRMQDSAVP